MSEGGYFCARRITIFVLNGDADVLHSELESDREVDLSELKVKNIGYSDYKL